MTPSLVRAACVPAIVVMAFGPLVAGADPKEEGGHPLAGRGGGLAELLRQAEMMERTSESTSGEAAAAPAAGGAKPDASTPATAPAERPKIFDVHDAISRRNTAVDEGGVFTRIEGLLEEQEAFVKQWQDARGRATPQVRQQLAARLATCKQRLADLRQPLFQWLACYPGLRRFLPQDRSSPDLRSAVDVRVPDELAGDAAHCFLTPFADRFKNTSKAREVLAKVPEDSTAWQVLRARAALAAEAEEWAAALALANKVLDRCPPPLANECEEQSRRYQAHEPWRRGRGRPAPPR